MWTWLHKYQEHLALNFSLAHQVCCSPSGMAETESYEKICLISIPVKPAGLLRLNSRDQAFISNGYWVSLVP